MTGTPRVAVAGATGFVGRATIDALTRRGVTVTPLVLPRLAPVAGDRIRAVLDESEVAVADIARQLVGCDAVVNAAGDPDASSRDEPALMAANALLPGVLARAALDADVARLVHVSSAVVQGNSPRLDESTDVSPFSAYSRSKVSGEVIVAEIAAGRVVTFRPPSVHARDRRVTRLMARIARSPLSCVARPGSDPTPQALVENVADAIAFLATCQERPPAIVAHPSEGLTTASILRLLGGREPTRLPRSLARPLVTSLAWGGRVVPALAANARRVEMLWFGQEQAPSWLTGAGWTAPAGIEAWKALGKALAVYRESSPGSGARVS